MKKNWKFVVILCLAAVLAGCSGAAGKASAEQAAEQLELAQKYLLEMNYQEAVVAFRKAIELDPKNADAYLGLSEACAALGEYDDAAEILREGSSQTGDETLAARQKTFDCLSENKDMLKQLTEAFRDGDAAAVWETQRQGAYQTMASLLDRAMVLAEKKEDYLLLYPCGHAYYGEIENGKRSGRGTFSSCSFGARELSYYDGAWEDDYPNGQGELWSKEWDSAERLMYRRCVWADGFEDGTVNAGWPAGAGEKPEKEFQYQADDGKRGEAEDLHPQRQKEGQYCYFSQGAVSHYAEKDVRYGVLHARKGYDDGSSSEAVTADELRAAENYPRGEIPFGAGSFGGHYYYIYDLPEIAGWEAAKEYCEKQGGYLAVVGSREEDEFLYSMVVESGCMTAMIGLSDAEEPDEWKWVSGEPLTYAHWSEGEPNHWGGDEHYGMYYYPNEDGSWNDGDGASGPFFCEWGDQQNEVHEPSSGGSETAESPDAEDETGPETEEALSDGWHETDGGWQYAENGRFLSHCWKNIDGELYYFTKDGRMATQPVPLKRRKFTFAADGRLNGIADADGKDVKAWWDEDEHYYLESGNLMHTDAAGQTTLVYDGPSPIGSFAVEGETIYGFWDKGYATGDDSDIFTIGTNGQNLRTQSLDYELNPEFGADMDVCGGTAYYTGFPEYAQWTGMPDWGGASIWDVFSVSGNGVTRTHEYRKNDRDEFISSQTLYLDGCFRNLQASDEGLFCLCYESRLAAYGGLRPRQGLALFTPGNRQMLVERNDIDQFFVCDGLFCYMAGGQFIKEDLRAAMARQENEADRLYEAAMEELTDRYGMVPLNGPNSDWVEVYYTVSTEDGSIPQTDIEPMPEGILASCQEDMDMDGVPELLVLYPQNTYEEDGSVSNVYARVEMYRISQGQVTLASSVTLGEMVNAFGTWTTDIFIKTAGNRKLLGINHDRYIDVTTATSGSTGTDLYEYDAAAGGLVRTYSGGHGIRNLTGEETEQYENELASFGIELPLPNPYQESDYRFLLKGQSLYSLDWSYTGQLVTY